MSVPDVLFSVASPKKYTPAAPVDVHFTVTMCKPELVGETMLEAVMVQFNDGIDAKVSNGISNAVTINIFFIK